MSPEHEIHTLLILKTAKEAEINAKLSLISLKSDLNLEKLNLLKFIILLNQDDKYFVAVQDTVALMRVNSFTTLLLSTYTSTSDYSFKRDILLLLFLIYYSTPSDSPVDIIKTIFNYDSLSSHSPLDISLIQEIVHISSLLSLELLNLDGVPIKLDINSILSVLDDSNHEYKSLFYAGLSCWLESQVDGDFDVSLPQLLMQRAYSFNILEYISQILTVTCNPSNPTSVGYKSVLKGLFCSILKYYPINRLPNISLFTDNIQHLLSNDDALCESFLDDLKDLDFLQVLKQRFPVSLDFVKIQTGLTSSSSINEIFTSFSNLNTFAMTIPLSRLQVKNDLVVLLQDEIIGGNIFKLSIPKNASGILVSNDPIVVFNISYSGWYYILASLDSYNNIDIEIIHLLNLLLEVSKHGYLSQLIHHSFSFPNLNDYEITNNSVIELVCRVLNTSVSKRDFKNIPSLLEILSCSIIENQELVWDFVISSPLFPNSSRLVMVDIFELEKTSATFSITRNFIKLITNLVDTYPTTSIKTKFIINSMQFIFGLVFPIQSTLKYKIKSEKYNLQQSILNLFVNVISTSNQEIQIFTIDKFNSSIHVKSLLELSCIGNKSVSELYVFGRFNECNVLEDIIIKSLKLVKYLIMYRIDNNLPISNLEVFIIERELIVDEENKNVVLVIAEYIKFEFNISVSIEAVHVLKLIGMIKSTDLYNPPSFVGCFDDQKYILIGWFLKLSIQESSSPNEVLLNDKLVVSIFNLVEELLDNQIGFSILFFNSNEYTKGKTIVDVVFTILGKFTDLFNKRPRILESVLSFISKLFQHPIQYTKYIEIVCKKKLFWETIDKILLSKNKLPDLNYIEFQESTNSAIPSTSLQVPVSDYCLRSKIISHAFEILSKTIYNDYECSILDSISRISISRVFLDYCTLQFRQDVFVDVVEACESGILVKDQLIPTPLDIEKFQNDFYNCSFFNVDVCFGDCYAYNLNLVWVKYKHLFIGDEDDGSRLEFVSKIAGVNHDFSISDSNMSVLTSLKMLMQTVSLKRGYLIWKGGSNTIEIPCPEKVPLLYEFILDLADSLLNERRKGYLAVKYRNLIAETFLFSINHWIKTFNKITNTETILNNVIELIDLINTIQTNDIYPIVDSQGVMSDLYFHETIFSSLMSLLQHAKNLSIVKSTKYSTLIIGLFPLICSCLGSLLTKVQDGVDEKLPLMIALMSELISSCRDLDGSSWIPILENYKIVSLLLDAFSFTLSQSEEFIAFDKDKWTLRNGFDPTRSVKISNDILVLLSCFADIPDLCDLMAFNGILATFSNNSMTSYISEGKLDCYIGDESHPWNETWCLILELISRMLGNLTFSNLFIDGVTSFILLYWDQITKSFDISLDSQVCLVNVETANATSILLCLLSKCMFGIKKNFLVDSPIGVIKSRYQEIGSISIKRLAELLQHPQRLKSLIIPVTRIEKDNNPECSRKIKCGLLNTIRNLVDFILTSTQSTEMFVDWCRNGKKVDSDSGKTINVLFSYGYTASNVSISTLFDLFTWLQEEMKVATDSESDISLELLLNSCEAILFLIVSQLAGYMSLNSVEYSSKREAMLELTQELVTGLSHAQNQLKMIEVTDKFKTSVSRVVKSVLFVESIRSIVDEAITINRLID